MADAMAARVQRLQGIPLKLRGIERFLTKYPEFKDRIALYQVGLGQFASTFDIGDPLSVIKASVDKINAKFGPVVYFEHRETLPLNERIALWHSTDLLLNTSTRVTPFVAVAAARCSPRSCFRRVQLFVTA